MNIETVDSVESMQALLDTAPYTSFLGLKAETFDATAGHLEVSMAAKPPLLRAEETDQFHGGPIAGMIDTVAACLIAGIIQNNVPTINIRIDYIRPSHGSSLRAVAIARRVGRTVAICDIDVFNDQNKLVAIGRGTFGAARPN